MRCSLAFLAGVFLVLAAPGTHAQQKSAAEKVREVVERRKASPQVEIEEGARAALRAHYLQEIRPYLADSPALPPNGNGRC